MIEIELEIHVRRRNMPLLNSTTVALLKEIERRGSVRTAARELHYSYQHAWDLVDGVNRAASTPVVIKQRGGEGGGGAHLSDHGRNLISEFHAIEQAVKRFAKKLNTELNL